MKYWLFDGEDIIGPFAPYEIAERTDFSPNMLVCPEPDSEKEDAWQAANTFDDFSEENIRQAKEAAVAAAAEESAAGEQTAQAEPLTPAPAAPEQTDPQSQKVEPPSSVPISQVAPEEEPLFAAPQTPAQAQTAPETPVKTEPDLMQTEQEEETPTAHELPVLGKTQLPPLDSVLETAQLPSLAEMENRALAQTQETQEDVPAEETQDAIPIQAVQPTDENDLQIAEMLTPADTSSVETPNEQAAAQSTPTQQAKAQAEVLPTPAEAAEKTETSAKTTQETEKETASEKDSETVTSEDPAQVSAETVQEIVCKTEIGKKSEQTSAETEPKQVAAGTLQEKPLENQPSAQQETVQETAPEKTEEQPKQQPDLPQNKTTRDGNKILIKSALVACIVILLLLMGCVAVLYKKGQKPSPVLPPTQKEAVAPKTEKLPLVEPEKTSAASEKTEAKQPAQPAKQPVVSSVPKAEIPANIPTPPPPQKAVPPLQEKAISIVKKHRLEDKHLTVEEYLAQIYRTQLSQGYTGNWSAELLHKNTYIVKYRLTKTRVEPIIYVFQADVQQEKLTGALNNITLDLIGKN